MLLWLLTVAANTAFAISTMFVLPFRQRSWLRGCAWLAFLFTYYRIVAHVFGFATLDNWLLLDQVFVLIEVAVAYSFMRPYASCMETFTCQAIWLHVAAVCLEYSIADDGNAMLANQIYCCRAWAYVVIIVLAAATIWQQHNPARMEMSACLTKMKKRVEPPNLSYLAQTTIRVTMILVPGIRRSPEVVGLTSE